MAAAKLTTERDVRVALAARYDQPEYAVLPGVADGTGHNKTRTVDAIIVSLWPSRGLWIAGVEIKVSRGDLLRELRDPAKQESVYKHCDYFYLAVGDASIVRDGDVPETWGLLVPGRGGKKMKVAKEAPKLTPEPMSPAFLASILRRAHQMMTGTAGEERSAIRKEVEADVAAELKALREESERNQQLGQRLKQAELIDRFFERAGIRFAEWNADAVDEAAALVCALNRGGKRQLLSTAKHHAEGAKRLASRMAEDADVLLVELAQLEREPEPAIDPTPTTGSDPGATEEPTPANSRPV
jgi:hypothetical protein